MTSRANHRTAGEATRKRAKASCRQRRTRQCVCGGHWNPKESLRLPHPGATHSAEPHPVPRCHLPQSQQPQTPVQDGRCPECGTRGRGWRPSIKATEQGEGHIVCPFWDSRSHSPSLSPPRKLPRVYWVEISRGGDPERPQQLQPQAKVGLTPPTRPSGGARCPQAGAAGGPRLRGGTRWGGCSPVSSLHTRVTSVPKGSLLGGRSVTQLCPGHMVRQAWERGR